MNVDPTKLEIVRVCLEAASKDYRPPKPKGLFDLNADLRFEVEFDRAFIEDISHDRLKSYIENHLLPKVRANPDKKFFVGPDGIEIRG